MHNAPNMDAFQWYQKKLYIKSKRRKGAQVMQSFRSSHFLRRHQVMQAVFVKLFKNYAGISGTFSIWVTSADLVSYGSRSKTHARLLLSQWHLQKWMRVHVFCFSGAGRQKVRERSEYHWILIFINIHAQENMIRIPCPDSDSTREAQEKACWEQVSATIIFNKPPH